MLLDKNIISRIRDEYGEAFYLLDSMQFRENFTELKNEFASIYPDFNIAYSYKTNYTPKLCMIVNELGGYAEVVSEMEVELALRCGVAPGKIIWNGPVKNAMKLEEYLLAGVTVNIDSYDEAVLVSEIAGRTGTHLRIGLRCNYDVQDGVVSRFGFDIDGDDFRKALTLIADTENIDLVSLQCHFAKRQLEYWPARAKGMLALIDRLGVVPERIDIGGGLFGKMADSLKSQFSSRIPEYREYAEAAASVFSEYFEGRERKPELLIEPGSALVGDCMKFVGTVKTVKNVRGHYFATVLASQKNISMTGVNPPIEIIHMSDMHTEYAAIDLVGYTCIEGDVLYRNYSGTLDVGDAVVISNCGSYSIVMKPPFILPNFPILDICDGDIKLVKRGETFDDVFRTYEF